MKNRNSATKDRILFAIAVLLGLFIAESASAGRLHDLKITRRGAEITQLKVEAAVTPEERARGLMFRKYLLPNRGMWFIFDEDTSSPFWMKNTYISLDIIFVDSNTSICYIYRNAEPLSEKLIYPKKKYRYVLEVPAGFADSHGIKIKDKIRLKTAN